MVDINRLQSALQRTVKVAQRALDSGDVQLAEQANGVLSRLNAITPQEPSSGPPQGLQVEGPPADYLQDSQAFKEPERLFQKPKQSFMEEYSQRNPKFGTEQEFRQLSAQRQPITVPQGDGDALSVLKKAEQDAKAVIPPSTSPAVQDRPVSNVALDARLREIKNQITDITGMGRDIDVPTFFNVTAPALRANYQESLEAGKAQSVFPDSSSPPVQVLQLLDQANQLRGGGKAQASKATPLAPGKPQPKLPDVPIDVLNDKLLAAMNDPSAPPEESAEIKRLMDSIGQEPKFFTLENILMALFFGAPIMLNKHFADLRQYRQNKFSAESLNTRLSQQSPSSKVAADRQAVAQINALGRAEETDPKGRIADLRDQRRGIEMSIDLKPADKAAALQKIDQQIAQIREQIAQSAQRRAQALGQ